MKPKHAFEIVFKSGHVRQVRADTLEVERDTRQDEIINISWTNMEPHNVALCVGEIESVWQTEIGK